MKQIIDNEYLKEKKIAIENEEMPNGENRFRIRLEDNSGINITNSGETTSWQNAHYHRTAKEVYCVQKGYIIMAVLINNEVKFSKLIKGDSIEINPQVNHNVYMAPNSETFVIKFGTIQDNDWYEAPFLDEVTKNTNIKDLKLD